MLNMRRLSPSRKRKLRMKIMKKIFKHMKYLKKFKTKADAVGQTIAIPSVLSIKETPDSVGYLNTDIGIK